MFEIEKNVPLPPKASGRGRKYPFPDMAVGDSIFIPSIHRSRSGSLASLASKWGKFSSRKEGDGLRIWRVS